jgi:hypothetical protein
MGLRNFQSTDGASWTVWLVRTGSVGAVPGTPSEWLAFQNEDGSERRRLMEIPPNWTELSDHGLDLLLRRAEPVKLWSQRHSPPSGVDQRDTSDAESDS